MKAYAYAQNDLLYTLRKFPNHPRALHMLGELGKATQDYGLPIVHFEKAIKLFPQYAYTHAQYGEYLVEIGAVKAGISELKDAIRIDPNLVLAQAWLDKAYERIGARNRTTSSPP
jgi:predicted Zn-dependent protease